MSFGYSVGNFIAGYNLTYDLIKILSDSRRASMEYQEAVVELSDMEQAFLKAGHLVSSKALSKYINYGIACIVLSSVDIIENFHERSRKYQRELSQGKGGIVRTWRHFGWTPVKKEELRTLKNQLQERLISVNTLMTIASYRFNMPASVAQYEDNSSDIGSDDITQNSLPHARSMKSRNDSSTSSETTIVDTTDFGLKSRSKSPRFFEQSDMIITSEFALQNSESMHQIKSAVASTGRPPAQQLPASSVYLPADLETEHQKLYISDVELNAISATSNGMGDIDTVYPVVASERKLPLPLTTRQEDPRGLIEEMLLKTEQGLRAKIPVETAAVAAAEEKAA
ncbi:hypothetical protein BKA67DRAFT_661886 [Truncatella angustata]|uniref:Uncharacterized protein n=1 Tax=Truncatella angustata TaxID=152316 RepID=A0A9P8UFI2_9PEZI|nr:uncharacterized protein BKA67DRAFT_661886 [Truncatella angustata]KAH6648949.1 hypothetical protein BKA67DRAFT_661886 [Truncatella angustata]KAH8198610.1 hypothetical protein TruAng_007242 [Truncatella angustata]